MWLTGDAGGGGASGVSGIYNLPYQYDPVMFTKINTDGSVNMKRQDSVFILAIGKEWNVTTSRLDTTDTGIALLTGTERITNYGFQFKSRIHA